MGIHDDLRQLASLQYGFVARRQVLDRGGDRWLVQRLTRSPAWSLPTPRVLQLVGTPAHPWSQLMLGTLDGGPGTVVSRLPAAAVWKVPGYSVTSVELARQRGNSSRPPAIGRLYPVRYLPEHLTTTVDGIPVVSLPFLLYQLAGLVHPARAERALETVITRSPAVLVRLHELLPELAEHGRNGIVFMREFLDRHPPGTRVVDSGLEKRFERILREFGEPPLERQVDVGGHEFIGRVDYLDREQHVIYEVDSELHHASDLDRQRDAERDARLLAAGFRAVVRIPEEWIWHAPHRAVAQVRATRRRFRGTAASSDT